MSQSVTKSFSFSHFVDSLVSQTIEKLELIRVCFLSLKDSLLCIDLICLLINYVIVVRKQQSTATLKLRKTVLIDLD